MNTESKNNVVGVASHALLAVADPQPVPSSVCQCPECGGNLWWQVTTDDGLEDLTLDCENEPEIDSDEEDFHRFLQSDWQPVIDRVKAWILSANSQA